MNTILLVIHVVVALSLIVLVLIQHGKGADMGAAFGSGASNTVFGARGAGSFLTRTTAALAALFLITNLSLAFLATKLSKQSGSSVVEQIESVMPDTSAPNLGDSDVPSLPSPQGQ